jgi:4-amino-4-deoxy-L-arabinose transferase-like glycosyltransferase
MHNRERLSIEMRRFWRARVWILALLLIGAALRLLAFTEIPPGLYRDEAQHGLDALRVLEGGGLPLYFTANNGREPLFIYLVTVGVALLGRTPWAVRLPAFFTGMLTLAATYDLARVLFNRRVGRWALTVLAVTFWHVHLSRVGFRAVLLPLLTALFLAQAARGVRSGRRRHWAAAGALYGLAWYTYTAVRFTPVALAAFFGYALLAHRRAALQQWQEGLIFAAAALLVLAPLGVYTLQHPQEILQRTGQVSVFSPAIHQGAPVRTLLRHIWRTAGMFFVQGDRIWRHNLARRPVWGPALGLAFVLGVGVALARLRQHAGAALVVLWTAVMAVPTILAEDAPHFLRGVGVLPVVALLPALGLAWISARIADRKRRLLGLSAKIAAALPALLILLGGVDTTVAYFVRYAEAPLTYHWFEAGPVALAGEVNALRGAGWDGSRMQRGAATERTVYLDRRLWESWAALPFLIPEEGVRFLPGAPDAPTAPHQAFVVWPYRDWGADVWPRISHPTYLQARRGPQAQGDLDAEPTTIALILQAAPVPELPPVVAHFDQEITLHAALVRSEGDGVRVRLWWRAGTAPSSAYKGFVHYLRGGEVIAQHDGQPGVGALPTPRWQPGDVILDERFLPDIAPDPAGDTLRVGFYEAETLDPLAVVDETGEATGTWVELPVILEE